eukprot:GHUV01027497.1.p2 GENE.GHUV01027497.1~~GHUV01027497.1.p2  ORF type:complete len:151 (+),score=24.57 GHUV01027497.1:60-455(+)
MLEQTMPLIDCSNLVALPELPGSGSFQKLNVSHCLQLRQLPKLPSSLVRLDCSGLQQLPSMPGSLRQLDCQGCTQLVVLPQLPPSLEFLNCSDCLKLQRLPNVSELPNLQTLSCRGCKPLCLRVGRLLVQM